MVTSAPRPGEAGYNLVMLVMAITVLNVLVAVALPMWSHRIRREKEEEAIFRGLQYAEAIRVFQQRFGRYPASLEELVEVEPRSIRRLWKEPLSQHGQFGLVVEAPRAQVAGGSRPGQAAGGDDPSAAGEVIEVQSRQLRRPSLGAAASNTTLVKLPRSGDGEERQLAEGTVIHGVYLDHEGESIRLFFDRDRYERWAFTVEMIPLPQAGPQRPASRVPSHWIGKPFPEGLTPRLPGVATPGGGNRGTDAGAGTAPSRDGRPARARPRGESESRPGGDDLRRQRLRPDRRPDRLRERPRGASSSRRR